MDRKAEKVRKTWEKLGELPPPLGVGGPPPPRHVQIAKNFWRCSARRKMSKNIPHFFLTFGHNTHFFDVLCFPHKNGQKNFKIIYIFGFFFRLCKKGCMVMDRHGPLCLPLPPPLFETLPWDAARGLDLFFGHREAEALAFSHLRQAQGPGVCPAVVFSLAAVPESCLEGASSGRMLFCFVLPPVFRWFGGGCGVWRSRMGRDDWGDIVGIAPQSACWRGPTSGRGDPLGKRLDLLRDSKESPACQVSA